MGEITPGISLRIEEYGHSNRIALTVHQADSIGPDYYSVQNVGFGIYKSFELAHGYRIEQWINDPTVDIEFKREFRRLLNRSDVYN